MLAVRWQACGGLRLRGGCGARRACGCGLSIAGLLAESCLRCAAAVCSPMCEACDDVGGSRVRIVGWS